MRILGHYDVFTVQDAQPYIESAYHFLSNCRSIKDYSKITLDSINGRTRYSVGFSHTFRHFASVARFIANLYICFNGKLEGYNSFKMWIHTARAEDKYQFRIDDEYWFDEELMRHILASEWNEIDSNHYLLSAAYRFLDDERHLLYSQICPEKVCDKVFDSATVIWKENLGSYIDNDFLCELGVPVKIDTFNLEGLARICKYSYVTMIFNLIGRPTVINRQLDSEDKYNEEDVKDVQIFFHKHLVDVSEIHFGEFKVEGGSSMLYALIYLGSIPNANRQGKQTKGITRCGLTICEEIKNEDIETATSRLTDYVSRAFNDNGYIYEQFKKKIDKKFRIKR